MSACEHGLILDVCWQEDGGPKVTPRPKALWTCLHDGRARV